MTGALVFWALIFGSVGLGMFVYGRKQKVIMPFICGLCLMVFPYFVSDVYALVAIGVVLIMVAYFVRI